MSDISKLVSIQLLMTGLFIIGKGILRPFILEQSLPVYWDIFVLSLPNFFEGTIGVILLTTISLYLKQTLNTKWGYQKIYLFALIFSTVFVITQEFKLHNLGGENIYDPYDVLFSLIGLATGFIILLKLRPKVRT